MGQSEAVVLVDAGADRFAGIDWELGRGGAPLLTDALATLECEIVAEHPTGDHHSMLGHTHFRFSRLRRFCPAAGDYAARPEAS